MSDGITSLPTLINERMIRGDVDVRFDIDPFISKKSLERELLLKGYTSMQNKLKHYMMEKDAGPEDPLRDSPGREPDRKCCDTKESVINEAVHLCLERADTGAEFKVGLAIKNTVIQDFFSDTKSNPGFPNKSRKNLRKAEYTYKPKQEFGTGKYKNEIIRRVGNALAGNKTFAKLDPTKYRFTDRLLTEKRKPTKPGTEENLRNGLILAAYMLGMDIDRTNLFLTKSAFTYRLDLLDPWELSAAFLLYRFPVEEQDTPDIFRVHMNRLISQVEDRQGETFETYQTFKGSIWETEIQNWRSEYFYWKGQGKKKRFLAAWAWKRMVSLDAQFGSKDFCSRQLSGDGEREMSRKLSKIYLQMEDCAERDGGEQEFREWLAQSTADRKSLVSGFIHMLKNSNMDCAVDIVDRSGKRLLSWYPAFPYGAFREQGRTFDNIKKKERPLCRDDIIKIGIAFGLSRRWLDYLLVTAGFYRLYVRDFYEKPLVQALYDHETKNGTAGFYLNGKEGLAAEFCKALEKSYAKISENNRKKLRGGEPEWVRWAGRAAKKAGEDGGLQGSYRG